MLIELISKESVRSAARYMLVIGSEGLQSGFHFILNITLIIWLQPVEYGIFAVIFLLAGLAVSIGNALISTPLGIHLPQSHSRTQAALLDVLLGSAAFLLAAITFLFLLVALLLWIGDFLIAVFGGSFVALWTSRYYVRARAFAARKTYTVVISDLAYVAVSMVAFTLLIITNHPRQTLLLSLIVLTAGNIAAITVGLIYLKEPLRISFRKTLLFRYRCLWGEVLWIFFGVATTAIQTTIYAPIIGFIAGPAALAPVAAGNALFGPLRVAAAAWQNAMRPELSAYLAEGERHKARRIYIASVFMMMAICALAGLIIFFAWDAISNWIFSGKYRETPLAFLVALWWMAATFSAICSVPSGLIQANRKFRSLAYTTFIGSLVNVAAILCILMVAPPYFTPLACVLSEALTLICVLWLARRHSVAAPGRVARISTRSQ